MFNRLNLKVKSGDKIMSLNGGFLNKNGLIEFDSVDDLLAIKTLYKDGKLLFQYKDLVKIVSLSEADMFKIEQYQNKILNQLKLLFKNIQSDKEKIMLIYLGDNSQYKYLATTKTAFDYGYKSPKYTNALTYSFSDTILKKAGLPELSIKTNSEMQIVISTALNNENIPLDVDGIGYIKYSELLGIIKREYIVEDKKTS